MLFEKTRGKVFQNPRTVDTINASRALNNPQNVTKQNQEALKVLNERLARNPENNITLEASRIAGAEASRLARENSEMIGRQHENLILSPERIQRNTQNVTKAVTGIVEDMNKPPDHSTWMWVGAGVLGYIILSKG